MNASIAKPDNHDPRLYWIGFNLVRGIGAVRFRALLDYFGDAAIAWSAPIEALTNVGLSERVIQNLVQVRSQVSLEKIWHNIQAQGIQVLTWEDEQYPRHLLEIDQPPPVIYLRGALQSEDEWAVAVVGTRRMTVYGRQVAEDIAIVLASSGVTVVSGLARGVDAVAHQAAFNAGGRTIAVLGSGVDRIYPPENRQLAEQIMQRGAVLSDYAPGTPPDGVNFPPRNHIISGLSLAVIVIGAGSTSGALIIATFSADQGREVFAVPGNITAPQSKGTNRLIQDGAHPVLDPRDVLEILNLTQVKEHHAAHTVLPADATEAALFQVIGSQPLHIDEIRALTSLPIETVSGTLALMELKEMVRQFGGMQYAAVREKPDGYSWEE